MSAAPQPSGGAEMPETPGRKHPPVPPVSRRSQPRFGTRDRRSRLAAAFQQAGGDYDRLRPGYPKQALDLIAAAVPGAAPTGTAHDPARVVDLGAGTGRLSLALARRGFAVTALDPSPAMLAMIASGTDTPEEPGATTEADRAEEPGRVATAVAPAEDSGLPDACTDLVTAAQAWHWFDTDAASREARRLLRPGGVLALLWNTLDVRIPWVHRYARIMHAGDIQRDDFSPPVAAGFTLEARHVLHWEDPMPTGDLIDLARTRSYVITADEPARARVRANLDWYLHEHLGHAPGEEVGLPYRTDLFLYHPPLRRPPADPGQEMTT